MACAHCLPPSPPSPPLPPASPPPASPNLRITKGVGLTDPALGVQSDKYTVRMKEVDAGAWEDTFVFYNPSGEFYDNSDREVSGVAKAGHKTGYFISLTNSTNSWITYEAPPDLLYEIEISKVSGEPIVKVEAIPNNRAVHWYVTQDGKAIIRVRGNQYFYVDIDGQMNDYNTAGWAKPVTADDPTGMLRDWPFNRKTDTFHVHGNPPWELAAPLLPYRPTEADCGGTEWHCVGPDDTWDDNYGGKRKVYFKPGVHQPKTIPPCCSTSPASYGPLVDGWSQAAEDAMQSGELCYCDKGGTTMLPENVKPIYIGSDTTFFLDENAWIDGGLSTADGTSENFRINILGFGHISGRKYQNRLGNNNNAVKGVNFNKIMASTIVGPTLVDSVNHGWILNGKGSSSCPNCVSMLVENWNLCSYLKVLNWRGNGDGIHIFNFWHDVTDTYMRTQDGSMYFGTTMETYTTWRRVVLWNDANGVPFMLSGNSAVEGKGLGAMDQVDIIYQRKQYPEWCGGIFDLRNVDTNIGENSNISIRNVYIQDPFPTCPIMDVGGGWQNIYFKNVHMRNFSTYRDLMYMYSRCDQEAKGRFFMHPEFMESSANSPYLRNPNHGSRNCMLPKTGIPVRWVANAHLNYENWNAVPKDPVTGDALEIHGYRNDTDIVMRNVNLDDVTYGGVPLYDLFINRDGLYPGAVVQGGDSEMFFDGVWHNPATLGYTDGG